MKLMKIGLAAATTASLLFAGCSAPVAVTEDNAPSELLKKMAAINSDSPAESLTEVFQEMVDVTYDQNLGGLKIYETGKAKALDTSADTLQAVDDAFTTWDVRVGTATHYYQLYEFQQENQESTQEASDSQINQSAGDIYGIMETSATSQTTVYTALDEGSKVGSDKAKMTIDEVMKDSMDIESSGITDLEAAIRNSVIYPLYSMFGSSLLLQPISFPNLYTYKLEKVGSDYRWTISMSDMEEYNTELDTTYQQYYGTDRLDVRGDQSLVLDSYELSDVSLIFTVDENGAISKIETTNKSKATMGDDSLDLNSTDTVTINGCEPEWTTFFEDFFYNIDDESLKQGDTFTVLQKFENKASESKASEDSSAADKSGEDSSSDKNEDKAASESRKEDSKETSSDKSKADDSSKTSTEDSKADSKKESSKADSKTDSKTDTKTDSKTESKAK